MPPNAAGARALGAAVGQRDGATVPSGNAATGHPYTGINILILCIACEQRGFTTQNWHAFRQALAIFGAGILFDQPGSAPLPA